MLYAVFTKPSNGVPFANSLLNMVLQNGYVAGSVFGPDWKHVQEWPEAGPSRLQGENEEMQDVEEDEYEEEEEEVCSGVSGSLIFMLKCPQIYITLDLGPNADPMTLGTGTDYQLIVRFLLDTIFAVFIQSIGSGHADAVSQDWE